MRLLLSAFVAGLALSFGVLGIQEPAAEGAFTEQKRLSVRVPVRSDVATPESELILVPAHGDSNTEGRTVQLNQHVIEGKTTIVCSDNSDVRTELESAVQAWNTALDWTRFTDSQGNTGGPFEYFEPASSTDTCASNSEGKDVHVYVRRVPRDNAVYWSDKQEEPPRKLFAFTESTLYSAYHSTEYSVIALSDQGDVRRSTIIHELGHVLGLSDYMTCTGLRAQGSARIDPDPADQHYALMYNASDRECRPQDQETITDRDLRDLYEAYHVEPVTRVRVPWYSDEADAMRRAMNPSVSGNTLSFTVHWGKGGIAEAAHNASRVAILGYYSGIGWEILDEFELSDPANPMKMRSVSASKRAPAPTGEAPPLPAAWPVQYKVVGLTQGDIGWEGRRIYASTSDATQWNLDRALTFGGATYTEGDPTLLVAKFQRSGQMLSYPPTLSASLSPRYCWTGDTLTASVWAGGGSVDNPRVRVAGNAAWSPAAGLTELSVPCGSTSGPRQIAIESNHDSGPLRTIDYHVHKRPGTLVLRWAVENPLPGQSWNPPVCDGSGTDTVDIEWRINGLGSATLEYLRINDTKDGGPATPTVNIPCEDLNVSGSGVPLTAFALVSDGRGVTRTTLESPASLTASAVSGTVGTVELSWPRVPGASGYEVRHLEGSTKSKTMYVADPGAGATTSIEYPDTKESPALTSGTTYTFQVRARKLRSRTNTWTNSSQHTVRAVRTTSFDVNVSAAADQVGMQVASSGASAAQSITFHYDLRLEERLVAGGAVQFERRRSAQSPMLASGHAPYNHVFSNDGLGNNDPGRIHTGRTYRVGAMLVAAEVPGIGGEWVDSEDYAATFEFSPSVTSNSATLTWGAVAGASGYETRLGERGSVAKAEGTSHRFEGLREDSSYELFVRGVYEGGARSAWASETVRPTAPVILPTPTGLRATLAATSLTLHWQAAPGATLYQVSLDASRYEIATGTSHRYDGLTAEREYTLAVRALHTSAWSSFATLTARTTAAESPSAPPQPTGLRANMTATSAGLSWTTAAGATSYAVKACAGATCLTKTVTALTHTFNGLTPSTSYEFSVVAKSSGGDSAAASRTESTLALPVPSGLQAALIASGLVSLQWSAAADADGYDLRRRTGGGAWTESLGLTTDFELVTGLTASTRYEFQVRARLGEARSAWSASLYATTPETTVVAPPTPSGLQIGLSATSARLSWVDALRASSYEVKVCSGSGPSETCLTETETTTNHTFTGLTPSTAYTFSVVAKNSGGDSQPATITRSTPAAPSTLPDPTGLGLSAVGSSAATLNWRQVDGALSYEVKACAGMDCMEASLSGLSHRFRGLTPAVLYMFSVRAKSGTTVSDWTTLSRRSFASVRIRARKLADGRVELGLRLHGGEDIQPRNRFANPSAITDGVWRKSETLSYTFDGTTYELGRVSVKLDNTVCPAQVDVSFLPASGAARIIPSQYRFAVNAPVDRWGETNWIEFELGAAGGAHERTAAAGSLLSSGPASASAGAEGGLMAGDEPIVSGQSSGAGCAAAPSGLGIGGVSQSGATLSWSAVTNASQYDVRVDGGSATELASNARSHPFSGLSAGATYSLEVRARSAGGASGWSSRSVTLPPPEPTGVRTGSASENSLTLSWDAAAGATSYQVKRTDSSTVATKTAGNRSHHFSGLSANTTYTLSVRALNAGGASDWVPVSATTGQVAPPPEPTNVQAGSATSTSLLLTWTGPNGVTFKVKRTGSAVVAPKDASERLHTFDGLRANTNYTLSVRSVNAGGESTWVNAQATTERIEPPTGLRVQASSTSVALTWDVSAQASSYDLSACAGATCKQANVSGTSHTFTGLTPSTLYRFGAAVRNSGGVSTALTVSATTPAAAVLKPPAPTGLSVTTTATGASLSWNPSARATSYDVSACANGSCKRATPSTTSQPFTGLTPSTQYTFGVAARNSGGVSTAVTLNKATQASTFTVSGRMEARRVTSGRVELAFTPTGGSRILPTSRYLDPNSNSFVVGKWYKSSAVTGQVNGVARTFGLITARLVATATSRYIEICFIPQGGSRTCPTGNVFFYRDPTTMVNTWYWTGSRSYTAAIGGQVSGASADEQMGGLAAGAEDPPGATGGAMADLVPSAPAEPDPNPVPDPSG